MPPRFSRHALRRAILLLSCALSALHSAPAQTPTAPPPGKPAAAATGAMPAKPAVSPPAPGKTPAKPAATPGKAGPAPAPAPATAAKAAPSAPKPGAPAKPGAPPAATTAAPAKPAAIPAPTTVLPSATATAAAPASPKAGAQPRKPAVAAAAAPVSAASPAATDSPAIAAEVQKTFKEHISPFIKTYCFECHGDRRMKGGVNFAPALKNPSDPAHTRRWKMGLATVNAHDMPPDDADKQPTDAERETFMAWVGRLKYLSPKDPGAFVIRRLTKTEYGNTLHDLLGVPADIVKELPDEVPGEGYLNTLSPLQMEQYLGIANEAVSRAIAPPGGPATPYQIDTRARLFGLNSAPPAGATAAEVRAAARGIAQKIARSTFRRPPTAPEIEVLLSVFDLATKNQLSFDDALRLMLKAALVSPQFLYITPAAEAPAGSEIVPLDDWMLASRLSYLLWATLPDAELATLADQGKLHDPATLGAQVQRMLSDDRARALFDGFGAQWLGLADLADKTFDTTKFPQMTPALRQAMYDEARLFFSELIRSNAPVTTFITADFTYVNEDLLKLYAHNIPPEQAPRMKGYDLIFEKNRLKREAEKEAKKKAQTSASAAPSTPAAAASAPPPTASPANASPPTGQPPLTGSRFRRVYFTDANRGGILGMPGILATTSFPNRTSPVKRGVWVLEQILGEHIPPAPPNVPTLEKQDKKKIASLTLRQRTELHRTNVVCANCHKILDPIGFGLENFDAIGRWRAQDDTGGPIDAAGELPGGKRFSTPAELKAIIAARKTDLARNLTEKLLAYALCRQLEGYDEIVIDELLQSLAPDNYRLQPLITAIVTSYPFMNRRVVEVVGAASPAPAKPAAKK
ncbi:DUF1592 domain-containing protein [Prosthecobacter sp.]|uniref:DUF1592 domain-containing protein n=1 Tax=Prosthecobacter sp. TaxID=1965333 RepID=UPI003782F10C